jgi:sugar (pentulose or hexulose) kinase
MGLVDVVDGTWRMDILEKVNMSGLRLPEIVCGFDACGVSSFSGVELKVYPDFGDQQMSVLGCFVNSGDMVVNIATAGQIILVDEDFRPGDYEIRPFFEGAYCNVVSRMPAGRNLDVQIEYLREVGEKVFDVSMSREEIWSRVRDEFTLDDTHGLTADVSFYELPHKLADGAIMHINHYNMTLHNLFSAILQDMGRVYARYISMVSGPEGPRGKLVFSGGAALNTPAIMKVIEQQTSLESLPAPVQDEVHTGMLRAALICTGRCRTLKETTERILIQ